MDFSLGLPTETGNTQLLNQHDYQFGVKNMEKKPSLGKGLFESLQEKDDL